MSKKSIILLTIGIGLICSLIVLIIISLTTYRDIVISKEFSVRGYGNSYSIDGELQNCSDKTLKLDKLIISTTGRGSNHNTIHHIEYSLSNITINKKYIVRENNLKILYTVNNDYVTKIRETATVKCIIDGKEYSLSSSPNSIFGPIIISSFGAITAFVFLFISLKNDKKEKQSTKNKQVISKNETIPNTNENIYVANWAASHIFFRQYFMQNLDENKLDFIINECFNDKEKKYLYINLFRKLYNDLKIQPAIPQLHIMNQFAKNVYSDELEHTKLVYIELDSPKIQEECRYIVLALKENRRYYYTVDWYNANIFAITETTDSMQLNILKILNTDELDTISNAVVQIVSSQH